MAAKSFVLACKEFFGYRQGQTLTDFKKELDDLSAGDRQYFIREFAKIGIEVSMPVSA